MGDILGSYRDSGKENGSYYNWLGFRVLKIYLEVQNGFNLLSSCSYNPVQSDHI